MTDDDDDDEVTSWAELADEFASRSEQCRQSYEQVKDLVMLEAVSKTGRDAMSWLSLHEAYDNCAIRMRYLIPRLGDKHGPPQVGDIISGDRLDQCPLSTILRGDRAGVVAIRTVNGWSVSGMNALQAQHFVKHNFWKVVEVPERKPLDT